MMRDSLKGVLLSGLVFPGVGQLVLRHYKRGIAFILPTVVILLVIVLKAVEKSFTILEKIKAEGGAISMNTITNATIQGSTPSESLTFKLLFFCLSSSGLLGLLTPIESGRERT